jgi:hypothetical protein
MVSSVHLGKFCDELSTLEEAMAVLSAFLRNSSSNTVILPLDDICISYASEKTVNKLLKTQASEVLQIYNLLAYLYITTCLLLLLLLLLLILSPLL